MKRAKLAPQFLKLIARVLFVSALLFSQSVFSQGAIDSGSHTIAAPKILVNDIASTQAFYERVFGLEEMAHLNETEFEESIIGFGAGATLALVDPNDAIEKPLEKTEFPEIFISIPDEEFDDMMERLKVEDVELFFMAVPEGVEPPRGVIAEDPSGNRIEIFAREGAYAITGVKVVVDDIDEAEAFYGEIFGASPQTRYGREGVHSAAVLSFNSGPTLGLYQPLSHPMLPKSQFPLVLFYSSEFDALLARVNEKGIEHEVVEAVGLTVLLVKDPADNWLEIISSEQAW